MDKIGRRREVGLGTYPDVQLAKPRDYARNARDLLYLGVDMIADRQAARRRLLTSRESVHNYIAPGNQSPSSWK